RLRYFACCLCFVVVRISKESRAGIGIALTSPRQYCECSHQPLGSSSSHRRPDFGGHTLARDRAGGSRRKDNADGEHARASGFSGDGGAASGGAAGSWEWGVERDDVSVWGGAGGGGV